MRGLAGEGCRGMTAHKLKCSEPGQGLRAPASRSVTSGVFDAAEHGDHVCDPDRSQQPPGLSLGWG